MCLGSTAKPEAEAENYEFGSLVRGEGHADPYVARVRQAVRYGGSVGHARTTTQRVHETVSLRPSFAQ